ncbi:hypothetical protein [Paenibacillus sp. SI8]|uniref:hypothetical protein n=1 Tax=unclassified Paenibacillus TaxID=185978 RepID=UPI003466FB0B
MKACSQVCGVVFDPLDENYVNVCEECEETSSKEVVLEEDGERSYYLGACGLIFDYLL